MFRIVSQSRKCEEMSTISRLVNFGTGIKKLCSDVIVRCVIVCRFMMLVFSFRITLEIHTLCSEYRICVLFEPVRR